ncbi:hypothetical protein D3C81_989010 [compost metagenome]
MADLQYGATNLFLLLDQAGLDRRDLLGPGIKQLFGGGNRERCFGLWQTDRFITGSASFVQPLFKRFKLTAVGWIPTPKNFYVNAQRRHVFRQPVLGRLFYQERRSNSFRFPNAGHTVAV